MEHHDHRGTLDHRPWHGHRGYVIYGLWLRVGIIGVGVLLAGLGMLVKDGTNGSALAALVCMLGGGALGALSWRRAAMLRDGMGLPNHAAAERETIPLRAVQLRVHTLGS